MTPPFWASWWFRALILILLGGLLVFLYKTRIERLARKIRFESAFGQFCAKYNISDREKEIILLVLSGCSNKKIEDKLFISVHTVKNHIYNIYQKLDINNRAQLVALFKNLRIN
jgi:DNA-binding CsgD family transcriptional regulator